MTPRDDLRIGDAERDAAVTALREHYAQGRLTHEELDERIGLALSARTGHDLALTHADLPDLYGSRPEGHGGRRHRHAGPAWAAPEAMRWHGGPPWAGPRAVRRHGGRRHGPDLPGFHPANRRHRRGGPPVALFLGLALVIMVATTGLGALKFLFLAWLVMTVLGVLHRRSHRRWRLRAEAHARRLGYPGAL
ncbi:DUF1707 domain-containing protein [Streptosporangium sp. NPDC000396]|uniref:DUF1707 SHOCT-like domain-containing protein n=1 Tax=Streptosporangium sp. NPDC000396 TaxID=3366185 RepID=UPI003692C76B